MRISDWSSDVCSSDLIAIRGVAQLLAAPDAHRELDQHRADARRDDRCTDARDDEPDLQARIVEHAHLPRHAHQAEDIERREGDPETDDPAPEADFAPDKTELVAERLGPPTIDRREQAETQPRRTTCKDRVCKTE